MRIAVSGTHFIGKSTLIQDFLKLHPYRKLADKCFKKIYRDEACDIFPGFNQPRIIEITGEPMKRVKILESYLK